MAKAKKIPSRRSRYKNDNFLKSLGRHCRQLRRQRGYSIDRVCKEADQLSPASVDRLERGSGDSQVLVLERYAKALGCSILDLFAFLKDTPDFSKDPRIVPYDEDFAPPLGYVPVYPLKVAAGKFIDFHHNAEAEQPLGWVDLGAKVDSKSHFASFVNGDSMTPTIADGSLCLFRRYVGGSRQGKIFLVQARGLKSNETGDSFVIKRYMRITPPRQSEKDAPSVIHLISENSKYPPIILVGIEDSDVQVLAEFVRVL